MWDDERHGPDEVFTMTSEIVAVEHDTAVARLQVRYGDPVEQEYRDVWIMHFAGDGRCRAFEEWPFWPSRDVVAPDAWWRFAGGQCRARFGTSFRRSRTQRDYPSRLEAHDSVNSVATPWIGRSAPARRAG
jgi:hypothetical protein